VPDRAHLTVGSVTAARASGSVPILAAVLAALAMALPACAIDAVRVPVPAPDPEAVRLCQALHQRLPQRLRGQERRTTVPDSPLVAAWGTPAIALRCGVPRPPALTPTSELAAVDGLPWLPEPPGRPARFTAVGLRAYVEVTVPAAYAPAGEVLGELGPTLTKAIPAEPAE
jgi:hypothetical protein